MERDIEKSTLDVLALASVLGLLTGAALNVSGAPWQVTAYFSIVGALFDIVFSFDFFVRLQKRRFRFPWLAFLSSVLPLVFVSGPFLAGWALNDLGAAAVRGFWLGVPPASGFTVFASLRLFRITRPFWFPADQKKLGGPSLTRGYRTAAIVGIAALLAGAFASDVRLIPGPARASEAHRAAAMTAMAAAQDNAERVTVALSAEAVGLRILGRPLLGAPPGLFPADYAVESLGGMEAWFPVADERRARGAAAVIATLASLAAAIGYAVSSRIQNRNGRRPGQQCAGEPEKDEKDCDGEGENHRQRRRDAPAGTAELAGILGKRPY